MRRKLATAVAALAACVMTIAASPAAAQSDDGLTVGYKGGWYLLAGATGGASFAEDGDGGFVGGELSVAHLRRTLWFGLYADAAYEFSQNATVVTAGPEFGYGVFGVDGGVGLRTGIDGAELGPQARLLLTFGIFSLYGRIGHWPNASTFQTTVQTGAMLKFPLVSPWGFGPSAPWDMGD